MGVETDWITASVFALAQEPVVVVRLQATEARGRIGTGDFATPAVAWHFMPSAREEGGAPAGLRAFGHQYTEFALPVFSDEALSRWRLLPFRPAVVMPLGLVAPDGRTLLLAPLESFHEQVIGVPAGKEQADSGLRVGWHGDIDQVEAGFFTDLALIAGDGPRDCFASLVPAAPRRRGRGARARRRRARHPAVVLDRQRQRVLVPHRTGARHRLDDRRRGRRPRSARRARRRGAARLVVVPARSAAPVRHRRMGGTADGHGPLGAACRRAPRRRRRAARAARTPAPGRALPPPLGAVRLRRRVRDVDRRRSCPPAGSGAVRAPARPMRRVGRRGVRARLVDRVFPRRARPAGAGPGGRGGRKGSMPRSRRAICTRSGAWHHPPTSRRPLGCAT